VVKEDDPSETAYKGSHYYTTVIYTELDTGTVLRHVIKLTDNYGTTEPAPTALISYTTPDGKQTTLFEQTGSQTIPLVTLPYSAEIPLGTKVVIKMNDNYNDNNYADGLWEVLITKDGLFASYATEGGGFYHNTSLLIYDDKTEKLLWEIPFPYKPGGADEGKGYWYNFDIPYITFGRLRPLHTNAVIFAFGGCVLMASAFYSVQRTCGTRLWSDKMAWFTFWGWNLIIVAAVFRQKSDRPAG